MNGTKLKILDGENGKQYALVNGIRETTLKDGPHVFFYGCDVLPDWDVAVNGDWHDLVFRNFPVLHIRFGEFFDCTFENCQEIEFVGCGLHNCVFKNSCVKENSYVHSRFFDCKFEGG